MATMVENRKNICDLVIQKFWSKLDSALLKEFNYDFVNNKNDDSEIVIHTNKDNADSSIVSSLRSAINDLKKKEDGSSSKSCISNQKQQALNIVIKAGSYKSGLSKQVLGQRLGVRRNCTMLQNMVIQDMEIIDVNKDDDDDCSKSSLGSSDDDNSNNSDSSHDSDEDSENNLENDSVNNKKKCLRISMIVVQ